MEEPAVEGQRHQSSRANSEALPNGSSGVSRSIEPICPLPDFLTHFSHFGNSTCIVTDWAVAVNCQRERQVGQHSQCRQSHSVVAHVVIGEVGSDSDENDWQDSADVAECEAQGDIGGRPCFAGVCQLSDRPIAVRCHKLCECGYDHSGNQAHQRAQVGNVRLQVIIDDDALALLDTADHHEFARETQVSGQEQDTNQEHSRQDQLHLQGGLDFIQCLDFHYVGGETAHNDADQNAQRNQQQRVHEV